MYTHRCHMKAPHHRPPPGVGARRLGRSRALRRRSAEVASDGRLLFGGGLTGGLLQATAALYVCTCSYIYIYICLCTCIYTHVKTMCLHTDTWTRMCVLCMYACEMVCMHIYICVYIYIYMHADIHLYIYIYMYAYTYTIHIHIQGSSSCIQGRNLLHASPYGPLAPRPRRFGKWRLEEGATNAAPARRQAGIARALASARASMSYG